MFNLNPLLNADSYKFGHVNMYPEGTREIYSNFTPRSLKRLDVPMGYSKDIVWVGGQAVVQDMHDMWQKYFFNVGKGIDGVSGDQEAVEAMFSDFSRLIAPFAGGDYPIKHLRNLYNLGYLPIEVKTLDEGSIIGAGIPVLTIRNTLPEYYWLTNFLETWLSAELWHISTTATIAYHFRKIGMKWYNKTGASIPFLDFAFHDFSLRGQTSLQSGVKSGAGHLMVFNGTDTVPSIPYLEYHYHAKDTFIGASVPATEHSIQTSYQENDETYIREMIKRYPTGIVSIVVDGYDYWDVLTNVLPKLKNEIISRGEKD